MRKYELFEMSNEETMMDMYTRFTNSTNELKSLGKSFTTEELVRKILRFLPQSWETKVTAIQEAKNMNEISLDELIGNLQTYELRRSSQVKEEIKRVQGLALKALEDDGSNLNEEKAIITGKLKKKARENSKKKGFSKPRSSDCDQFTGYFMCGKHDHTVKINLAEGRTGVRTVPKLGQKTVSKKFYKAFYESSDGSLGGYFGGR